MSERGWDGNEWNSGCPSSQSMVESLLSATERQVRKCSPEADNCMKTIFRPGMEGIPKPVIVANEDTRYIYRGANQKCGKRVN